MRTANRVVAVIFILLGLLMVRMALEYGMFAERVGTGPGFMPGFTGGGIILLGLVLFVQSRNEPMGLAPGVVPDRTGRFRVLAIIISLAVVIVLVETIGFRLGMFLYLMFTMTVLGKTNQLLVFVISLAGSLGVYWVFVDRLMVPLPTGIFGF